MHRADDEINVASAIDLRRRASVADRYGATCTAERDGGERVASRRVEICGLNSFVAYS